MYSSTNGHPELLDFKGALLKGQAPDKGLYVPQEIPRISKDELIGFSEMEYPEIALRVMRPYLGNLIPEEDLVAILKDAHDFPEPLENPRPLRLFFAASSPTDLVNLEYELEVKYLLRAISGLEDIAFDSGDLGSFQDLRDHVEQFQPHVVHLTGHGSVVKKCPCADRWTGQTRRSARSARPRWTTFRPWATSPP